MSIFLTTAVFVGAAITEIAGSFAFWAWLRLGKSVFWVLPGIASLAIFAILLTRVEVGFAGRTYAAFGGVYVAASLLWLWIVESTRPDAWDTIGGIICLVGTAVIVFGPRTAA